MKIIGELENTINSKDIKKIYEKGFKIAISFDLDTVVSDMRTVGIDIEGSRKEGLDAKYVECVEGLMITSKGDIAFRANSDLVIIDRVEIGDFESLGYIKPFKAPYKDWDFSIFLHDDTGEVATKVFEVAEN